MTFSWGKLLALGFTRLLGMRWSLGLGREGSMSSSGKAGRLGFGLTGAGIIGRDLIGASIAGLELIPIFGRLVLQYSSKLSSSSESEVLLSSSVCS